MKNVPRFKTPMLLGCLSLAVLLVAQPAMGAWILLDRFDSYDNTDTHTTAATGGKWSAEFVGTNNSHVIDTDPNVDPGHDQVLQTKGGAAWRGAETDLTQWGAGTALGATNSYFFQFKAVTNGAAFDIMTGLSADVSNIDTNNAWQDFAVMPFLAGAGDGTADYKMTDAGLANDDIITDVTLGQWYNVWWVVNNDPNVETYDVYVSTGTADGTYIGTAANYRNGFTNTALNAMGFMAAGGDGSQLLVDNIYFASGVNTSYPIPEPATLALLGLGLVAQFARRRMKTWLE